MGVNLDKFMSKFEEFKNLPPGEFFSIKVTEKEATDAVREYVSENKEWIKEQLKAATKLGLSVENPTIKFGNDELSMEVTGSKGILKSKASLISDVLWKGKPEVKVRTVKVPFVSLSAEKLNTVMAKPIDTLMEKVKAYGEIRSFKLTEGMAVLEAVRKASVSAPDKAHGASQPAASPKPQETAPMSAAGTNDTLQNSSQKTK